MNCRRFSWFQFTVFICILFILPTAQPVTAEDMNYSIAAIGAVVLLVGLTWLFWGRFHFKGPVQEVVEGECATVEEDKEEIHVTPKH